MEEGWELGGGGHGTEPGFSVPQALQWCCCSNGKAVSDPGRNIGLGAATSASHNLSRPLPLASQVPAMDWGSFPVVGGQKKVMRGCSSWSLPTQDYEPEDVNGKKIDPLQTSETICLGVSAAGREPALVCRHHEGAIPPAPGLPFSCVSQTVTEKRASSMGLGHFQASLESGRRIFAPT